MKKNWMTLITVLVAAAALALAAGCACKYPQEEMDAARASLADAKAADAPKWAEDEYASAEDMLNKGERQANENECDDAKASAIEAVRLANIARELAVARAKAAMKPPAPKPEPVKPMKILKLATVYFDFDEYVIRADQRSTAMDNGNQLLDITDKNITITGHCDERGTDEYNIALGQKRADAVKSYLVGMGVDAARILTTSYGEEKPAAMGNDEAAWSLNRRAEFIVQ